MTTSVRPPAVGRAPGAWTQLRPTPRFAWLMAALVLAAASVGAREATRLGYVTDTLGGEFGVGVVAVVFALALAVSNVIGGRAMDRINPRPFLVGSLLLSGVLALANAWVLARGAMPVPWLVVSTAIEAGTFGVAVTALLKVQAAIVRSDARGAAETVNILRSGIGAALGTVIAGLIDEPVATLVIAGVVTLLVGAVTAIIVWPVSVPAAPTARRHVRDLVGVVRGRPALGRTVAIDLVLAAVLPTQFVALVIVDLDAPELDTIAFTASLLGILVGRLALTATGLRGNLTRRLRVTYLGFTMLVAIGVPLLMGGWLLEYSAMVAVLLFVGSALIAYSQNLPVALLQQQVPDDVRGSLSGGMNAVRNLLMGAVALALTALTYTYNAAVLAAAIAALLIAGFVLAGRFRGLAADSAEPSPSGVGGG